MQINLTLINVRKCEFTSETRIFFFLMPKTIEFYGLPHHNVAFYLDEHTNPKKYINILSVNVGHAYTTSDFLYEYMSNRFE